MIPGRDALSGASLFSGAGAGRLHERLALLSYCPATEPWECRAARRLSALPLDNGGSPKADPRNGPAFSLLPWWNGPEQQQKTACGESDSSIHFPAMSEGPHV